MSRCGTFRSHKYRKTRSAAYGPYCVRCGNVHPDAVWKGWITERTALKHGATLIITRKKAV